MGLLIRTLIISILVSFVLLNNKDLCAQDLITLEEKIQKAKELMEQGQLYYSQGKYKEAAKLFVKAYTTTSLPAFLFNAGLSYLHAGEHKEALIYFRKFLEEEKLSDLERESLLEKIHQLELFIMAQTSQLEEETEYRAVSPTTQQKTEESLTVTQIEEVKNEEVPKSTQELSLYNTPTTSLISVRTNPNSVQINLVDNQGTTVRDGNSPISFTVSEGSYKLIASHPNYKTIEMELEVKAGEVYIVILEMSQAQFWGYLDIVTQPPGAEIYIDDIKAGSRGKSPLGILLPVGKHKIWVEYGGYQPIEKEVMVNLASTNKIKLKLEKLPVGILIVKTNWDNATVYIDGVKKGVSKIESPLRLILSPGEYEVKVEAEGMKEFKAKVEVEAGMEKEIVVKLNPTPSRVSAWISLVASLAMSGVGIYASLKSYSLYSELEQLKEKSSLVEDDPRIDEGFYWGIGADVLWGLAAITTALTIYYFVRDPLPQSEGKIKSSVPIKYNPSPFTLKEQNISMRE